jgi:NADPH-dependent 2,4-dienoyl-CoA reductase/sulfur reductase-like enzyme
MIDGKVDLIHVSAGSHEVRKIFVRTHPSMFLPLGPNVYLAAEIKKHVKTPVATVGAINYVEMMEDIVASGKADVVALGRALLADPYLPKKAAAGRPEEIAPCLRCFTCITSRDTAAPWVCSVNPVIGNEYENKFLKPGPEKYKKVLIAGGGPAGMQAAITASARGHRVFLCEKSSSLGGAIRYAQYVPFKSDLEKFRKHLEYMLKASGAVVMMNTEVTPEFVAAQNPDVLIAAIGATPIVPNIRGIHNKKVIMAADVHNAGAEIGDKVVIIGGGLVGCEEGLHLAMQGKAVTVVEMLDVVARDANRHHKSALTQEMEKYARNMKIVTKTKAKAITEEGLLCEGPDGKEVLYKADTVICAVGYKSLTSVIDQLRTIVPEFYDIGDCVKPRTVTEAIRTGYNAAMEL